MFTEIQKNKIISAKIELINLLRPFGSMVDVHLGGNQFFVTGGCIGSLLRLEEPNDIDIYYYDSLELDHIKSHIIGNHGDTIAEFIDNYRDVETPSGKLITENAITFKNKCQLILKHCGTPNDVRSTFDFVHCMPYYDYRNQTLYISEEQYSLCMSKVLKVNSQKHVTQRRIDKFKRLNWMCDTISVS